MKRECLIFGHVIDGLSRNKQQLPTLWIW